MNIQNEYSIRIMLVSLEGAYRQIVISRQRMLESRMYGEYLMLGEFCQVLNAALIELASVLNSHQQ